MTDTAAHPTDIAPAKAEKPFSEYDDDRTKAMEASMEAKGESTTEPIPVDYFGFEQEHKVMLPDGIQWVIHKELNEGDRRAYLKSINRDVKVQRATGDAFLKMAQGEDRVALLKAAIVDWHLIQKGKPFAFSKTNVDTVLTVFPPKVVDLIHRDIIKHNSWLMGEATVEDLDREIATLQEQKAQLIEEQAGKGDS
jgi:hypothetical protein